MIGLSILVSSSGILAQTSTSAPTRTDGGSVLKLHYDAAQELQSAGKLDEASREYRLFIADALAELALDTVGVDEYAKAAPLFDEALQLAPRSPGLTIRYGQAAFAAHDLMRAKTLSEGVIRDFPGNSKALEKAQLLLGRVLTQQNQEAAAIVHFEAAVAINPNFENGYALAIAYLDQGDQTNAAKIFSEMISGLGDTAELHVAIGRAYLNSDFQQDAIPEFKLAISEKDDLVGAHYALAVAYLTVGGDHSAEMAKTALEAELRLSPNDESTHAQLGNIALRQQRYPDAERELQRAVALDPTDPNGAFYLGQLYAETNQPGKAIAALQRSIALTKDPSQNRFQVQKAHYQLGRLLLANGQSDAGKQEMQVSSALLSESLNKDRNRLAGVSAENAAKANEVSSTTPQSTPRETEALAKLADFEARIGPAIADSYNNLGVIAARKEDMQEALLSFERAYEWNPQLPGLDENWGIAAFRSGHYQEAIPALTRSLTMNPSNVEVRSELAIVLFKTGKFQADLDLLDPVMPLVDSTPKLGAIYAVSLMKTGKKEAGIKRIRALETANPPDPEVHALLGDTYANVH